MDSAPVRDTRVDRLSAELLPQVVLLARLFVRELNATLSRSEASLLANLSTGPRRITELADLEGLAQPTMTVLVKRLEERSLVRRARQREDGRVVIVAITSAGAAALAEFRSEASAAMRGYLKALDDEHVDALAQALDALPELIGLLQRGTGR